MNKWDQLFRRLLFSLVFHLVFGTFVCRPEYNNSTNGKSEESENKRTDNGYFINLRSEQILTELIFALKSILVLGYCHRNRNIRAL